MGEQIAPHGPFTCEFKFYFTNGDYDAEVTFDAPIGHIAKPEDVAVLAVKAVQAMEDQHQGFRLMTRDEFVQKKLSEQAGVASGIRFAVPEGKFSEEWCA